MKHFFLTLGALMMSAHLFAQIFTTPGDGSEWTLTRLAQTEGSGVSLFADDRHFIMSNDVTVSAPDRFVLEPGAVVAMANDVRFSILGPAVMEGGEAKVLFCPVDDEAQPYGLWMEGEERVTLHNVAFNGAGLSAHVSGGMDITGCSFVNHNGRSASYALNMGPDKSDYHVWNSLFQNCVRSAMGSGANISVSLLVEDCTFEYNGTSNGNYPQLNLTVGESVVLRRNAVIGDRSHTKVGGVVVANLMGLAGEHNTLFEDNIVKDNRFGIATYLEQKATYRNNLIAFNDTETNPMQGGSGINIYDPYASQEARLEGNYIENNLWGVTIQGGKNVNLGKTEDPSAEDYNPGRNTFYNNGFDGAVYDLYNNSTNTVYAQGNYWKTALTQDEAGIEAVIFHKADDATLGEVVYKPWSTEDQTAVEAVETSPSQPTEIYTAAGQKITSLRKGLNIVKRGNKVVKVLN